MTQEDNCPDLYASDADIPQIPFAIKKLGLASHHYGTKARRKDFKDDFIHILNKFDAHECDSILFASYTLKTNTIEKLNLPFVLQDLAYIRAIFFEELLNVRGRESCTHYHVWMKIGANWVQHICHQAFKKLKNDEDCADRFVNGFAKKRASMNFALMLCGETNIIFRQPKPYDIIDTREFLKVFPKSVSIILNPGHDKMGPGYMNPKKKYLSRKNRIIVSVWNEGKLSKKNPLRSVDGKVPWSLFENEQEATNRIEPIFENGRETAEQNESVDSSRISKDVRLAVLNIQME